jgi:hypothetical protein
VIGAVLILVFLKIAAYRMQDPAAIAAARSSFGEFDVPVGYRIVFALDNWPLKTLAIQRSGRNVANASFVIFLSKMTPMTPIGFLGTAPAVRREPSATARPRLANCRHVRDFPDERIASLGKTVLLRHARCDDPDVDKETATATFEVSDGQVTVSGTGTRSEFDFGAVRSLALSFR